MSEARRYVMFLVVGMVAFVVAIPVLNALFISGGPFDQLQQVVTGVEETTAGGTGECTYTREAGFVYPFSSSLDGRRVDDNTITDVYHISSGSSLAPANQHDGVVYEVLLSPVFTTTSTPPATVTHVLAIQDAGNDPLLIAWRGSGDSWPAGLEDCTAALASQKDSDDGRGNLAVAYSGGPGTTTVTPTAITDSVYAPILSAIFALIPLGLLLAVGWYFIGLYNGNGGRRGRR